MTMHDTFIHILQLHSAVVILGHLWSKWSKRSKWSSHLRTVRVTEARSVRYGARPGSKITCLSWCY